MKHFCVGDPHGDWTKWQRVLSKIKITDNSRIIILGDVIDRKDRGIEILKETMRTDCMTLLLGNHEYMMRSVIDAELSHSRGSQYEEDKELWYLNGGEPTHKSFMEMDLAERLEVNDYLASLPVNIELEICNQPFKLVHAAPIEWYQNHARSEVRRVGKECRSRWSPYH